eukprot:m.158023 g.158023  ORF g.158023 m.158023 type:complete len:420 (-) comp10242_c1_seq1:761-2020(-)
MAQRARVAYSPAGDEPRALIASFPNGAVDPDRAAKRLRLSLHRSTDKKSLRALVGQSDLLMYTGRHNSKLHDRPVRHLLGVYDPKTKQLELHDARFFEMHPDLKRGDDKTSTRALDSAQAVYDARADLIGSFGGKRKKQQLAARERNKLDATSMQRMDGVVQNYLDSSLTTQVDDMAEVANEGRPIPHFNLKAETIPEIYPMEQIISREERESLKHASKTLSKGGSKNLAALRASKLYTQSMLDAIANFHEIQPEARLSKALLLIYTSYLVAIRRLARGRGFFRSKLEELAPDMPEIVKSSLLERFTDMDESGERHVAGGWKQDLLLSYILVMYMAINDYHPIGIQSTADDLNVKPPKLIQHLRALGCSIQGNKRKRGGVSCNMWARSVCAMADRARGVLQRTATTRPAIRARQSLVCH